MKKLVMSFVLTVACMGFGVAFAEDNGKVQPNKDECLLLSKDCKDATLSIHEKIDKLNAEIQKGDRVYTADEIKKLQKKLNDTESTLNELLKH